VGGGKKTGCKMSIGGGNWYAERKGGSEGGHRPFPEVNNILGGQSSGGGGTRYP